MRASAGARRGGGLAVAGGRHVDARLRPLWAGVSALPRDGVRNRGLAGLLGALRVRVLLTHVHAPRARRVRNV
jgi:hypothetical protein